MSHFSKMEGALKNDRKLLIVTYKTRILSLSNLKYNIVPDI